MRMTKAKIHYQANLARDKAERVGGLSSIFTMWHMGIISAGACKILNHWFPKSPKCFSTQPDQWWANQYFDRIRPYYLRIVPATLVELRAILAAYNPAAAACVPIPPNFAQELAITNMRRVLEEEFGKDSQQLFGNVPKPVVHHARTRLAVHGFSALAIQKLLGIKPIKPRAGLRPRQSQLPQAPGAWR